MSGLRVLIASMSIAAIITNEIFVSRGNDFNGDLLEVKCCGINTTNWMIMFYVVSAISVLLIPPPDTDSLAAMLAAALHSTVTMYGLGVFARFQPSVYESGVYIYYLMFNTFLVFSLSVSITLTADIFSI